VPIDSDPDTPDRSRDTPAAPDRQGSPDSQANPELRAAWEERAEKFPERTRPTPRPQTDGGWAADGNRGLTPEENAEASKACADLRDEAGQVIFPALFHQERLWAAGAAAASMRWRVPPAG